MCEVLGANTHESVPRRPLPLAASGVPRRRGRRKLWDLPHRLHCPVIGTCLQVDELRRLARKAGVHFGDGSPPSDYAIHVAFVSGAERKGPLAVAAHKALERRYAAQVRHFSRARTRDELAALWQQAVARGEVPGALWATVTHPACDEELRTRTSEEVHMLSHQVGAGQRADLKALTQARADLAELRRDFDALFARSRQQLEEREQHIHDLERRLRVAEEGRHRATQAEREARTELERLRRTTDARRVDELEREAAATAHERQRLEQDRDQWRQACAGARQAWAALEEECRERTAQCAALEQLAGQALSACDGCPAETGEPPPDLGGRRILCVGGRHGLVEQYRAVVAHWNGRFDHHDGGLEERRQRLEAMLASADAVVCATDCVSHDAYHRLKRFCKAHQKPHVFLQSSGLTSFARAVQTMAS